jgi:hypothetical protein
MVNFQNTSALEWDVQANPTPMRRAITAYSDGTGKVNVACAAHAFVSGDIIEITGTTSYNGIWEITLIDAGNFSIPATWVADDGASVCRKPSNISLTFPKVIVKIISDAILAYRFVSDLYAEGADELFGVVEGDVQIAADTSTDLLVPYGLTDHPTEPVYLQLIPIANGAPTVQVILQ